MIPALADVTRYGGPGPTHDVPDHVPDAAFAVPNIVPELSEAPSVSPVFRYAWPDAARAVAAAPLGRDGTRPPGSFCYVPELVRQCTDSRMLLPTLRQRRALEQNRMRSPRYAHPFSWRWDVRRR